MQDSIQQTQDSWKFDFHYLSIGFHFHLRPLQLSRSIIRIWAPESQSLGVVCFMRRIPTTNQRGRSALSVLWSRSSFDFMVYQRSEHALCINKTWDDRTVHLFLTGRRSGHCDKLQIQPLVLPHITALRFIAIRSKI